MEFLSVNEISKKWGLSERSVRNYCANGKIKGAQLIGKTWSIPFDAEKPERKKINFSDNKLLNILKQEKDMKLKGGIYHKIQIALTYNSNHIEGSTLTEDQTRLIFETKTIGVTDVGLNVDDIIETNNHFICVDTVIDKAKEKLSEKFIKDLHYILKTGTSDSLLEWFSVGDYKKRPNEVSGNQTTNPKQVANKMKELIENYNQKENKTLDDIIEFHYNFETIHPFQDGNGRVGRLIMFKECLANNLIPFVIEDEFKFFYYRGLKEWKNERGYLIDTILSAQDKFKVWLKYFEIEIN